MNSSPKGMTPRVAGRLSAAIDAHSGLQIKTTSIEALTPLDPWPEPGAPKPVVPQGLTEPLFSTETAATYAILDAARIPNLAEMLEASGLEHRCLFVGQALADFADVAPWVVKLTSDADLTRALFCDDGNGLSPWVLWPAEAGIYLCCDAGLDQVWAHFRKFTRLKTVQGNWMYFRFWDPVLVAVLARHPAYMARFWARFLNGAQVLVTDPLLQEALHIMPPGPEADKAHSGGPVSLTDIPAEILLEQRRVTLARKFLRNLKNEPDQTLASVTKLPLRDQLSRLEADILLAQNEGLSKEVHIFRFVKLVNEARDAGLGSRAFQSRKRPDWMSFPAARKIAELEYDFKELIGLEPQ